MGVDTASDVVIVGAGPVGMSTAAFLDAAGVRVRVVDLAPGLSPFSKATTVHPRTLEVLRGVSGTGGTTVAESMVAQGTELPVTHFGMLTELLDYRGLDTAFPFVLMIPQARTERLLAEHLAERGVPIHRGVEVIGVDQDEHGVRLTVRHDDRQDALDAAFVVGADGARSTVRRVLGVGFPGNEPSLCGFVADVELDRPPAHPHFWEAGKGTLNALPLPGGAFRVFGVAAGDTGLDPATVRRRRDEPLDLDRLRTSMVGIAGDDWGVRSMRWGSRNTDTTRHVEHNRVGRVFLVGDAAHIHLPAGGQGLNVGIQDAANLAWKLAAEVQGWAPEHVRTGVHSYETERLPVARRLAANTLAQAAVSMTFTAANGALRDLLGDLIRRGGDTAATLTGWLSGLEVHYPAESGTHPLHGHRVPDLRTRHGRLHSLLAPGRFLLLGLGGRQAGPVRHDPALPGSSGRSGHPHLDTAITDSGWADLTTALVRPDGHLAHGWTGPDSPDPGTVIGYWTAPHQDHGALTTANPAR